MANSDNRAPIGALIASFARLGVTAFGGPVAHLGYFRDEFVRRRKWLTDEAYADLVALCQFLPGPASSQVGIGVGLTVGGYSGALLAWLLFTLPSAILLAGFGVFTGGQIDPSITHGLKLVAVGVVADALLGMGEKLCPDRSRKSLAVVGAAAAVFVAGVWGQMLAIAVGAVAGIAFLRSGAPAPSGTPASPPPTRVASWVSVASIVTFFALLFGLPPIAATVGDPSLSLFDTFYRAGALVFGGGHVVLPLLEAEMVPSIVDRDAFLAGYGAAQAVPGPLFTFASYLGAVAGGWSMAALSTIAIFLPSGLIVVGVLPFWHRLVALPLMRSAVDGINAAVVGLLAAAFYDPVITAGIRGAGDFIVALAVFGLLRWWKVPSWLLVLVVGLSYAFAG